MGVVARVGDGREELVQQVAMGAMHLHHLERGGAGAPAPAAKASTMRAMPAAFQRGGGEIAPGDGLRDGGDDVPAGFAARELLGAERAIALPGALHRPLPPGMAELDAGHRALRPDENP